MSRDREALDALRRIEEGARAADLETSTLDFKEDNSRSVDDTVREAVLAAICFANSDGGVIVQGVRDGSAGVGALLGTSLDPERLKERIYQLTSPHLLVDVRPERRHGKVILLVYVPRSPEIHADTKGRIVHRLGTDCVPMPPHLVARVRDERRGVDWSAGDSSLPPTSVSEEALLRARSLLAASADPVGRRLSSRPPEELLRKLGLLTTGGRLNRAGEVLFATKGGVTDDSVVYQYRETPGSEPKSIVRLSGPLLTVFPRLLEHVEARTNVTLVSLPDGQQVQIQDFPALAVREAVANALLHRDYQLPDRAVEVVHSPTVLVVTSPGPLVSGITPENILTHASRPRNPALMRAARVMGLAEEIGRGVDRMYREMLRAGKQAPRIEEDIDQVRVALVGGAPNSHVARFLARLPEAEREDTDTLLVLHHLCTVKVVTAPELTKFLQKGEEEVEAALRRLAADEVALLEPTRATHRRAHPQYRLRSEVLRALGTAIAYRHRTVDEIDRKVIAHVVEYRTVTNRTVQNLLDVPMNRARDILKDLVARKLLVKTSEHERGPGVEYGPGERFPGKLSKTQNTPAKPTKKRRTRSK